MLKEIQLSDIHVYAVIRNTLLLSITRTVTYIELLKIFLYLIFIQVHNFKEMYSLLDVIIKNNA